MIKVEEEDEADAETNNKIARCTKKNCVMTKNRLARNWICVGCKNEGPSDVFYYTCTPCD